MEGLPGRFGQAAAARRRPVLGRAATAPTSRPSLLAGVSDAERRARAMHKFGKLESLINRVQNSPRPFTSLAWAEKIEPELEAARAAEQQARMVAVTNDPRPEKAMEEVETFVEATDKLKNSVDLDLIAGRPDRLTWLDLTLSRLKISLSGIDQSAATPRQRGEIMGLQDGVHTLAMEVLEMDHAPAEEVVLKVEIVTGLRAKVEGLVYIITHAGHPPPRAAPLPPPRNPARLAEHPSSSSTSTSNNGSHLRHGATFSLAHAHQPVMGRRQAQVHRVSTERLQARYGY